MLRLLALVIVGSVLVVPASKARAEDEIDWTVDECAQPDAGCLPETPDDEATVAAAEEAAPVVPDNVIWDAAASDVACADGATNVEGACIGDPGATTAAATGGCATGRVPGLALVIAALGVVVVARRRRALVKVLALGVVACSLDADGWDAAVEAGPTGDTSLHVDVYAAALASGEQFLLAHQVLAPGAQQPVAQLGLSRERTDRAVFRVATAMGDRLAIDGGDELLGWARSEPGDGTAELVELQAPDGTVSYETSTESTDALVADGHAITARLGYVWPPGMGDAPIADVAPDVPDGSAPDELAAPAPCQVTKRSPLVLLYASPGAVETLRFLRGCPGEVVVGEKRESGPRGSMRTAAAHAAGGRTAFVVDRHGWKLRDLLLRTNGVERTAAYLRKKLQSGYDYIVIDEITAAPEWRDGATANRRLRKVLLRLPPRTVIPYISIDLTQYPGGFEDMRARRYLLRAFKRHARTIALEIYLHTAQVQAGAAPPTYRRAADRLAIAVRGMKDGGGINTRAISVIGTSMHSTFPQYRYLDKPSGDLASITRQVNAIRHGSKRLRQQRGLGYYFVNKSDMAPLAGAPYSYDGLIRRMRSQALRFR
ncbi:MAG: hypothetical protein H0T89_21685 [Deltaproteobacteria bacterium]|nr:hypothetical protein [Deltaproteobacteria bacterium]MDQ3296803.1 hypothetical protein [Myxococcota bacterium]